jgi:hypothetical protein
VRKYFVDERQVLMDAVCAGNPVALKTIRDTSGKAMARVQAVRTLEAIEETTVAKTGGRDRLQAPGIVIVIEQRDGSTARVIGPPPAIIEGRADEFGPVDQAQPSGLNFPLLHMSS